MITRQNKTVALTFHRSEILYDCKNYAYIEGDVMKTEDEHNRHQVIDIAEEGNVDRLTRVLDLAFSYCVELCYPFSKVPVKDTTSLDDTLEIRDRLTLRLVVPEDFSQTTVELMRRLVHELLVYKVMEDWMSITKPEAKANWQAKAQEAEAQIVSHLNFRIGRVRRTLSPFA